MAIGNGRWTTAGHVVGLACLGLLLFVAWRDDRPLHGDAAMYAAIAKTVAQSGEWLHLSINGEPYLNKPPLFFWASAAVVSALGPTTFAVQLVSGVLGVVGLLLLYAVCRAMRFGGDAAFASALVFATTPEVVHWTRGVHLESVLVIWLLLGILGVWISLSRSSGTLLIALAAAGGWLAKGPQALFAPAVAPILWLRDGILARRLISPAALGAAALLAVAVVPWTWIRLSEGTGYAEVYLRGQIGGVLVDAPVVYRRPLWYLAKLLKTYWPWLPFAAFGVVMLARRWREDAAARVWLSYAAVVVVVITIASVRKPRYLFPLYPALSVAAGSALAMLAAARPRLRLLPRLLWLSIAVAVVPFFVNREQAAEESSVQRDDAVAIARTLPEGAEVWLAADVPKEGMPGLAKVLGFYAPPLLCSCSAPACPEPDGSSGLLVLALADAAQALARRTGGSVERGNATIAVVRPGPGERRRLRAVVCAEAS